jgi:YihY family inner membrane protein
MGVGILLVSYVVEAIEFLENSQMTLFGWGMNPGVAIGVTLYVLGIAGEVLLFTSIYLVMPVVRVRFRHALLGGITAAVLWEITRRLLIWYYARVSMINVIYGSITITVVALLSIEVVATILLLGAQVIAELENTPLDPDGETLLKRETYQDQVTKN